MGRREVIINTSDEVLKVKVSPPDAAALTNSIIHNSGESDEEKRRARYEVATKGETQIGKTGLKIRG